MHWIGALRVYIECVGEGGGGGDSNHLTSVKIRYQRSIEQ